MKKWVGGIALLLSLSGLVQAKSFVWQVEKNGAMIFVGGTAHLLSAKHLPLPKEYQMAYQKSDKLVFEIDKAEMQLIATQQLVAKKSIYMDGRTLKTVLSPEVYAELDKVASAMGVPLIQLNQVKASMVGVQLAVASLVKQGNTEEGIDGRFYQQAKTDKKPIDTLETVIEQIDVLSQMAEGNEDEFIKNTIRDIHSPELFDALVKNILAGDINGLNTLALNPLKKLPDVYSQLVVKRNNNWIPRLEAMFKSPEKEYVLVGALHLWGDDGVLTQLKKKGYKLTQLDAGK